ncbi:MAG: Molybdopterin-guanine dinucleotide biosynthesis adapter protein [Deltaproteobacteria bacterium ADurb.Bin510]|nr:MAG: Molybdopterin-guanine dinucleotide biosynthesis adapter protein [Deltaproteobacteria bacterium ADurb.Bin510]
MPNEPAVLAVSGVKNSGKTTLIERLIPLLAERGLRVAVIKHDGHRYTPDTPGTDSYRYFQAGACAAVVYDHEKYTLSRRASVDEKHFMNMLPETDLILLEGFKASSYPKLEIVRRGVSQEPVCEPASCLAYVSDVDYPFDKPVFRPDDTTAIAEYICQHLKRNEQP